MSLTESPVQPSHPGLLFVGSSLSLQIPYSSWWQVCSRAFFLDPSWRLCVSGDVSLSSRPPHCHSTFSYTSLCLWVSDTPLSFLILVILSLLFFFIHLTKGYQFCWFTQKKNQLLVSLIFLCSLCYLSLFWSLWCLFLLLALGLAWYSFNSHSRCEVWPLIWGGLSLETPGAAGLPLSSV